MGQFRPSMLSGIGGTDLYMGQSKASFMRCWLTELSVAHLSLSTSSVQTHKHLLPYTEIFDASSIRSDVYQRMHTKLMPCQHSQMNDFTAHGSRTYLLSSKGTLSTLLQVDDIDVRCFNVVLSMQHSTSD